ncbi:bifunctional glutamate--cysteine ligase GshA/glutathione synthetase GshB [Alkalibacter mobilis]|uniref:bifunctional glutamate--cysteine ligase GshA/glutathione synthetase GshB n=1 Tax=Alkalibacter mobilis TaxID=2787712 RepID=UPI00189D751D|nr:bifunctional glutamate--cysteine ligase GshA/glutathione synthetase GshB [Alkalibacter mobilis]MBF7096038.1 bifunctional glutamate--cysteine ligase GshA/glutathione synthetase GshB [Alkalibacter mobilis]
MGPEYNLESFELSTQEVIKEAQRRGIKVEILDSQDNFIRLSKGDKTEIIRQATKTSADTYISSQIMENKEVTKILLAEAGIRVPAGIRVMDTESGLKYFEEFEGKDLVIKPQSTNFGLGVVVIKNLNAPDEMRSALDLGFSHDKTVMIEEFIEGKEYRFLVIGDEVVGVLHREPANVVGDGRNSIAQLIEIKNQDPLRGTGYKTPLEKIKTGRIEKDFLNKQGLDFDRVPTKNQKVYLRENSNISTGGDSLDFTDEVHEEYKKIAIKCANVVGARITGADIMIKEIGQKPNETNYGVIELNFNPALHIHNHPYKGKNRGVEKKLLDLLGF